MRQDVLTTDNLEQGRVKINSNLTELYGYNIGDWGGLGDCQFNAEASVSSASTALTTVASVFVVGDVGKTIRVFGAGAAGADLITTIAAYVSPTAVTLTNAASTTVSLKAIEWGTDNTSAIQTALDDIYTSGIPGTLDFEEGVYLVAGPLITSVDSINPNCQIYVPLNVTGVDRMLVKIRGKAAVTFNNGPLNNSNIDYNPRRGTIIKSIIIGSGTTPAVFCSSFANNGFTDVNRHGIELENIAIQVKSMTGTTHVAPTMSAWNLYYMGVATIRNDVYAFTESPIWNSVSPAGNGTYGIRLPRQTSNQNYGGTHGFALAQGFDIGIAMYEHDVFNDWLAVGCNKGFVVGQAGSSGGHPLIGSQVHVFACRYAIEFTGGPTFQFSQVSIERYPGSLPTSRWYDGVADFLATSLSGCSGVMDFNIVQSGGGYPVPTFSGTFDGQIKFRNLQSAPAYGFTLLANQPYDQLRYLGAAVSTDTAFPVYLLAHKQDGTAHVVGQIKFNNEQSPDAEKGIAYVTARTNGAKDKGLLRISANTGSGPSNVMDFTTDVNSSLVPLKVPSYTVAGVPSAATAGAGAMIYVSNEAGGAVIAFSDATNWRRVTDRAIIS